MNQLSKKDIQILESMKSAAMEAVDTLKCKLEELAQTAQEYYDDRTEKWQESPKGESYYEWMYNLEEKQREVKTMVDEIIAIEFDDIKKP